MLRRWARRDETKRTHTSATVRISARLRGRVRRDNRVVCTRVCYHIPVLLSVLCVVRTFESKTVCARLRASARGRAAPCSVPRCSAQRSFLEILVAWRLAVRDWRVPPARPARLRSRSVLTQSELRPRAASRMNFESHTAHDARLYTVHTHDVLVT